MKKVYTSVDEIICAYMDKKNKKHKKQRSYDFWAASSLGKCKRLQFLTRKNIETKGVIKYNWVNSAEDGHCMHEWRQKVFKSMGVLVGCEEAIQDDAYHYRGHYDAIVMLNGKKVLVDIKTQNSSRFLKRQQKNQAEHSHICQIVSYFHFLKKTAHPDLEEARLYYVNRDTGHRNEYVIKVTDELVREVLQELFELNVAWASNMLPAKEKDFGFCNFICPYKQLCDEYGEEQTKYNPTDADDKG